MLKLLVIKVNWKSCYFRKNIFIKVKCNRFLFLEMVFGWWDKVIEVGIYVFLSWLKLGYWESNRLVEVFSLFFYCKNYK